MKSFENLSVAVIGLGSIGVRHAKNFIALGVENITGFDPSIEKCLDFEKALGKGASSSFQEALSKRQDLVVIASPSCFHLEQAIISAEAGAHLFIEKPLSINLDKVDFFLELVVKKKLFVHVGSNWKFHPAFCLMKKLISEGALGKITGSQVLSGWWLPDWHPWEDYRQMYSAKRSLGGGIVLDSHEFDYITWLLGPVETVCGYTNKSGCLEIETEDVAAACIKHKSGAISTVHIDYIQREYRRRYHISGDKGTMEWDYSKGELYLYDSVSDSSQLFDVSHKDINEMYIKQAEHVLTGVLEGHQPVTSASTAAEVLKILCAIREVE